MKLKLPYRKHKDVSMVFPDSVILYDVTLRLSILFSFCFFLGFKFNYYIESYGANGEVKDFMDCFGLKLMDELPRIYSVGDR
jgi:hypothetical protein